MLVAYASNIPAQRRRITLRTSVLSVVVLRARTTTKMQAEAKAEAVAAAAAQAAADAAGAADRDPQLSGQLDQLQGRWLSWATDALDGAEAPQINLFDTAVEHVLWWLYESCCVFASQNANATYLHWMHRPVSQVMSTLIPALQSSRRSDRHNISVDTLVKELYTDSENMYSILTEVAKKQRDPRVCLHPHLFQQYLESLTIYELVRRTDVYRRSTRLAIRVRDFPDKHAGFGDPQNVTWSALMDKDDALDRIVASDGTATPHTEKQRMLISRNNEQDQLARQKQQITAQLHATIETALARGRFDAASLLQRSWSTLIRELVQVPLRVLNDLRRDVDAIRINHLVDLKASAVDEYVEKRYLRYAKQAYDTLIADAIEDGKTTKAQRLFRGRVKRMINEWCRPGGQPSPGFFAVADAEMRIVLDANNLAFSVAVDECKRNAFRAFYEALFRATELVRVLRTREPDLFLTTTSRAAGIADIKSELQSTQQRIMDTHAAVVSAHESIAQKRAQVLRARKRWYAQAIRLDALSTLDRVLTAMRARMKGRAHLLSDAVFHDELRLHLGLVDREAQPRRQHPAAPPQPQAAAAAAAAAQDAAMPVVPQQAMIMPIVDDEDQQPPGARVAISRVLIDWIAATELKELEAHAASSRLELHRTDCRRHVETCILDIEQTLVPSMQAMHIVAPEAPPPPPEVPLPRANELKQPIQAQANPVYGRQLQHQRRHQHGRADRHDLRALLSLKPSARATERFGTAINRLVLEPAHIILHNPNDALVESAVESNSNAAAVIQHLAPVSIERILDEIIPDLYPLCVPLLYYTRFRECVREAQHVPRPDFFAHTQ